MSEIDKLSKLLIREGIAHKYIHQPPRRLTNGLPWRNQVLITYMGEPVLSAICQYGSCGAEFGLIECYNFVEQPTGFLTAEQAFDFFIKNGAKEFCNEVSNL